MWAKKIMYMVLAASPIAFLGLIAVNARAAYFDWRPAEYGERLHQDWLAYAVPIRASHRLISLSPQQKVEHSEEAADAWLTAARSGELRTIPAVDLDDLNHEGARGELMLCRNVVIFQTLESAEIHRAKGNLKRAYEQYVDVIELAQINKYSTPTAVVESSRLQANTARKAAALIDRLAGEFVAPTSARLQPLLQDPNPTRHVLARMQVLYEISSETYAARKSDGTKMAFANLIAGNSLDSSDIVKWTNAKDIQHRDERILTSLITARDAIVREREFREALLALSDAIERRAFPSQRDKARNPLLLVSSNTPSAAKAAGKVPTVSAAAKDHLTLASSDSGNRTGTR